MWKELSAFPPFTRPEKLRLEFIPPPPPPRNFFLLTQDGGLSFPEDIRRNHVAVAEGAPSSLHGTKTATLKGVFVTRLKLNQSFEKPLLQHV